MFMVKKDTCYPNLFESVPFGKSLTARLLHQRTSGTLADDNDPRVSIVVRSFNQANKSVWLIEDIHN